MKKREDERKNKKSQTLKQENIQTFSRMYLTVHGLILELRTFGFESLLTGFWIA